MNEVHISAVGRTPIMVTKPWLLNGHVFLPVRNESIVEEKELKRPGLL